MRNVQHARTDNLDDAPKLLWLETCRRLRGWFPADPILIIDNLSNRSIYPSTWTCPDFLAPCDVYVYDDSQAGELLPYYVMASRRPFERAAYIHDAALPLSTNDTDAARRMARARSELEHPTNSVPMTHCLKSDCGKGKGSRYHPYALATPTATALWSFIEVKHIINPKNRYIANHTARLIWQLNHGGEIFRRAAQDGVWAGAYGGMAVFDVAFASMLFDDLGAHRLLPLIGNRGARMGLERVLGVLLSYGGAHPLAESRRDARVHHDALGCAALQGYITDFPYPGYKTDSHREWPMTSSTCLRCGAVLDDRYRSRPWELPMGAVTGVRASAKNKTAVSFACRRGMDENFLVKCCMAR